MQTRDWLSRAACLGMIDPMWDASSASPDALRVCFRCPVQKQCAAYGLARQDANDAGVLGGLGVYDRERIRHGQTTLGAAWKKRLAQLVRADWEEAHDEQFRRAMPGLELV
jgi:hypothetical protein